MTVAELIADLRNQDQERMVVIARDAEGNGFSPLADLSQEHYVPGTRGYVVSDDDLNGTIGEIPALVLWPEN